MKIAFCSLPAYGHLYPMMPLALACEAAGHDVVVATGEPFLSRLPIPTIPSQPLDLDLEWAVEETKRRHPGIEGIDLSVAMFADTTADFVSTALIEAFDPMSPDLVVYEAMNVGAGIAADVLGIPAVAYSIGLATFIPAMLHRAAVGYHRDRWLSRHQSPPDEPRLLAQAVLDPCPASLRKDSEDRGARRIPIRSVAFSERIGELPVWLTSARTRPRVYLTLGTVSFGAVEVLRRAVTELAAVDIDVLVAVGPEGDPEALGGVGDSIHLERFVAQSEIWPLVDLVVHHGGTGTVLGALASGAPQLILPQGADQFYNAEVVSQVGAGRALLNADQRPGAIKENVSSMLGDSPERRVAARLSEEIAAVPAPADVVPELIELATR